MQAIADQAGTNTGVLNNRLHRARKKDHDPDRQQPPNKKRKGDHNKDKTRYPKQPTTKKKSNDNKHKIGQTTKQKQKLEQTTTPDASKTVFRNKGQEGLSYINTIPCVAGNRGDPLFVIPGGLR
jgi:hypothetical protein